MGIMYRSDGAKYEGQWFNNKMFGLGTFTWPNGDLFIGLLSIFYERTL